LDLCHVDEAGFALTQPTTTTWGRVGCPRRVPYEAPQGRRLNVIGGYFSHGPQRGKFCFATFASIPQPKPRADGSEGKSLARRAAEHGVMEADVGVIDSEVFLAFVWQLAGRPVPAPENWRRCRPLMVVVDNYSVHTSERVAWERRQLAAADVYLVYLPAYSPELSRIEAQWKVVKYYEISRRSYTSLGDLKLAVEVALSRRAIDLRERWKNAH
jgi:transposase